MTARERKLAVTLLGVMILVGGGMLSYLFIYQPLDELWTQVDQARQDIAERKAELAQEEAKIDQVTRLDPRLAWWKQTSLPAARVPKPDELKKSGRSLDDVKKRHLSWVQVEYERLLSNLLRDSGFVPASISINPRAPEGKAKQGKGPPWTALSFTAAGRTKLEGLVRMLEGFHRTRLLHKVRNLTVTKKKDDKGGKGELEVSLTVEALQVNGAQARDTLLPGGEAVRPRVLAEPGRYYLSLKDKDPFFGTTAVPSRLTEDRIEVLKFVKLTTLSHNGRRWEAFLYDQGRGGPEKMLTATTLTDFTVKDKYNSVVLEGTVVHLDERQLIFRADGRYYRLRCGDFLYPAVEKPLKDSELRPLNLAAR